MTTAIGPIEQAALALLAPLLEGIVAGRLIIVQLEAGDDAERTVRLTWRDAEAPAEPAPATSDPRRCPSPSCSSANVVEVSGGECVCQDCATSWTA